MGKIMWFTGLSGSGKTTIAEKLKSELEQQGKKVVILDGDVVRNTLHKNLGFSPEDIHENNRLLSLLAKEKSKEADVVLLPIISPYEEDRKKARVLLGKSFVEVFIDTSLQECIKRDVKGHYKKALSGEIKNFIGVAKENPYQAPSNPEIIIKTAELSLDKSVKHLLDFLAKSA
jgi:adenylylsulfate kinase